MSRVLAAALLILPLSACSSSFSFEEAQEVARHNTVTSVALYGSAWNDYQTAQRRATQATLDWSEESGDGTVTWAFEGQISSDGPVWTGAAAVDGHLSVADVSAEWALGVDYDQVSTGATTIDGAMDWRWAVDLHDDGFHMEFECVGEIVATGDIEGIGAVDYLATVDVAGTSASISVEGKVDGRPVDFALTVNVPL